MEATYTHTITTLDGEEQEITLNRMTMRHGLKIAMLSPDTMIESLLDMVAPGVLDTISPESLLGLIEKVQEMEKSFFVRVGKLMTAEPKKRPRKSKSKQQ